MTDKIIKALAQLDPTNNNHWTSDNLPRIDTVKMLSGNQALTREEITKANPAFNRYSLETLNPPVVTGATPPAITPDLNQTTPEITTDLNALVLKQTETFTSDENEEDETDQEDYDLIAFLTSKVDEARIVVIEATKVFNDAQYQLDKAIVAKSKTEVKGSANQDAISGYLASQQRILQARGEQAKKIKDSGLTVAQIRSIMPTKAPVDAAMARNNSRGRSRPTF